MKNDSINKKHYALFVPFKTMSFVPDHYSVVLDNAEELAEEGNIVDLLYCDGKLIKNCIYNCFGNSLVCATCRCYQKYFYHNIFHNDKIKLIPVSAFSRECNIEYNDFVKSLSYNTVEDIKKIEYKGAKIGLAAFSSYLTLSRNLYPEIDDDFKAFFNRYLFMSAQTTEIVYAVQNKIKPSQVACFNARLICSRPIYDVCKKEGYPFVSYEVGFNENNCINKKFFVNSMPHDLDTNTSMINELWNSDNYSQEEKIEFAEKFFKKRRNSIASGDKVAYTKKQDVGRLPDDWNSSKHNISIFNSSEDEFASLGGNFEKYQIFQNQFESIKYIFDQFKDEEDIHFYLRIHPNLRNVKYKYHSKLLEFKKYDNVTVIDADSPISTYSLIDNSDKIIVFGSSVGFEAAYSDKPVILVGFAMYRNLDICYVANSRSELNELILNKNLAPKDKSGALKYSYFLVNQEFKPMKYYLGHQKEKVRIFGNEFVVTKSYIKDKLFSKYKSVILQMIGKMAWFISNNKFPTKESRI